MSAGVITSMQSSQSIKLLDGRSARSSLNMIRTSLPSVWTKRHWTSPVMAVSSCGHGLPPHCRCADYIAARFGSDDAAAGEKIASEIRTRIFNRTKLTASAGIASNRMLAKVTVTVTTMVTVATMTTMTTVTTAATTLTVIVYRFAPTSTSPMDSIASGERCRTLCKISIDGCGYEGVTRFIIVHISFSYCLLCILFACALALGRDGVSRRSFSRALPVRKIPGIGRVTERVRPALLTQYLSPPINSSSDSKRGWRRELWRCPFQGINEVYQLVYFSCELSMFRWRI